MATLGQGVKEIRLHYENEYIGVRIKISSDDYAHLARPAVEQPSSSQRPGSLRPF